MSGARNIAANTRRKGKTRTHAARVCAAPIRSGLRGRVAWPGAVRRAVRTDMIDSFGERARAARGHPSPAALLDGEALLLRVAHDLVLPGRQCGLQVTVIGDRFAERARVA